MLYLLADTDLKFASLFNDYVIDKEPYGVMWNRLHIDRIKYEHRRKSAIQMFNCVVDVMEIEIPNDVSEVSQLNVDQHNYWLVDCTIKEVQVINHSNKINTRTLRPEVMQLINRYNSDTIVENIKLVEV